MRTLRKVHSSQFPVPISQFPFPSSRFPVHSTPLKHSQSAAAKELARLSNASKFGFFFFAFCLSSFFFFIFFVFAHKSEWSLYVCLDKAMKKLHCVWLFVNL